MAELIKKSELEKSMTEDWLLENLAAQDSKSSIRKDIENVIDNLPTTTEAELRANVIEEFAERMKTICKKHQLGIDRKLLKPTYLNENGIWHSLIDDVVAQMKGEQT